MKRVLFLCIGNSCRSQMAEGFARCYGSDVMEVESAGLAPAHIVQDLTKKVMLDKNINIDAHWPKDLNTIPLHNVDLLVNMSGTKLPTRSSIDIVDWKVEDPIGRSEEFYNVVRDQIENLVMHLILEFRREAKRAAGPPPPPPPVEPAPAPGPRRFGGRTSRAR